eukprot:TRINITY_DN10004_c0_g1_i1.p2 TRINITY_DN10004_c0_g1~~TRINITY_DN10004_c0_g1_i1.p2  ORF type:complete len:117 (-),score=28.31 TRINITY_DN10004_c0_g1_i1:54-404(-)
MIHCCDELFFWIYLIQIWYIFFAFFFFLMIRRPPRSTHCISSAASDVYKRQVVRVVGENIEPGIYNIKEALEIAHNLELDLVEISPSANPPVCKVIDYKKFLYCLLYTSPSPRDQA